MSFDYDEDSNELVNVKNPLSMEYNNISEVENGERPAKTTRRFSGIHGHGLGMGEIEYDHGDETNGCDRCGCPDEQRCCPSFWNDRGIPPIWPLSCIFDPYNKHLNDNKYARMFGNFGFKFFDKERKAFMGTALAVTVLSIFITMYGLLNFLSPNISLLRVTAWGVASYRYNTDDGGYVGIVTYIGLQKFAVSTCLDTDNSNYLNWKECSTEGIWWSAAKCDSGEEDYYGFPCGPIGECGETSTNSQFGATMTCVTLIFAMIGCLTRMRKVADTNFQKMIGCFPDTLGIITQAQALALFSADCYDNMPVRSTTGDRIHYHVGAGYWAFVVCWLAAIIRASVHYCTPVPGGGVGCRFQDMQLAANEVNSLMGKTKGELNKRMERAKVDMEKAKVGLNVRMEKAKIDIEKSTQKAKIDLIVLNKGMEKAFNDGCERVRKNTGAPLFTKQSTTNERASTAEASEQEVSACESELNATDNANESELNKNEESVVTTDNDTSTPADNVATSDTTLNVGMMNNEIGP